jgi:cytoskeletal protein CcmA (bactofilin family)
LLEAGKGYFVLEDCDVAGDLDLFGLTVAADTAFIDCSFATIHAEYATFSGIVRFVRCTIAKLAARSARFERGLSLGNCDLEMLQVTGHVSTLSVQGGRLGEFLAAQLTVDSDVVLGDSTFRSVDLRAARVGGELRITGVTAAEFHADSISALSVLSYERTRIGVGTFVSAELRAGCLLRGAEVGSLTLHGLSSTGPLDLNGSHFGTLLMTGAKTGPVTLTGCTVDEKLAVAHAQVGPMAVTGTFAVFRIEDCEIAGWLQIADATFHGDLVLQRNKIDVLALNSPWHAGVGSIVVEGTANLFGNAVASQIQISHVEIGGELRLTDTRVPELIADTLTVGGDIDATMSRIDGGVVIGAATVKGTITLEALHAGPKVALVGCTAQAADLSGISVDGDVELDACTFEEVRMVHAHAGGALSFPGTTVTRELILTGTALSELRFDPDLAERSPAGAFAFPPTLALRGCKYDTLGVAVPNLIAALAAQPSVDGGAYASLQTYLRGLGWHQAADATIVTWRRQAKRRIPRNSARRWGSELLDLFSAYGTEPWRLLLAVAILLVLVFVVSLLPGAVAPAPGAAPPAADASWVIDRLRLTLAVALGGGAATIGGYTFSNSPTILGLLSPSETVGLLRDVAIALVAIVTAYVTGLLKYPEDR